MTSADHEFEKFREKKLNEKAAEKHEDDAVFFGQMKKKPEPDEGPKKMKLSDLNLPGADDRPDNIPKVGESVKLIDIALGNAPGAPPRSQRPGARPPGASPRPGAPRPQGAGQGPRPAGPQPVQRPPTAGMARPAPAPPRPPAQRPPTGTQQRPPAPGAPRPPTGVQRPPAPRPLIPPQGAPSPRHAAPPPPGFTDRAHAHDSERHEALKDEGFEDTAFVEATDHADPYEFRDQSDSSGAQFVDDPARPPARPPVRPPAPRADPGKAASERLRAVKPQPPAPQPKKTNTRRVKRGPLGR